VSDSRAGTARRGGERQTIGVAFPSGVTDRAKRRSALPLVRPDQLSLRSRGADAQLLIEDDRRIPSNRLPDLEVVLNRLFRPGELQMKPREIASLVLEILVSLEPLLGRLL